MRTEISFFDENGETVIEDGFMAYRNRKGYEIERVVSPSMRYTRLIYKSEAYLPKSFYGRDLGHALALLGRDLVEGNSYYL